MKYVRIIEDLRHFFYRCKTLWIEKYFLFLAFIKKKTEKQSVPVCSSDAVRDGISGLPLSRVIASLESVCKRAEPDFIKLGQRLETVYAESGTLEREILEAVKHISGESDENVLFRAGLLANESLGDLNDCHLRVTENLNHVGLIVEKLENLYGMCGMLEKNAMFLKAVSFNMAVESARYRDSSEMFTVVSDQIRRLSEKTLRIIKNISEDTQSTLAGQVAVYDSISRDMKSLHKLGNEARKALQDSVQEIGQLMETALKALEQAGAHTQEISLQVGEVVEGIQIHDSMNQRISHIIMACYDVQQLRGQDTGSDGGKPEKTGAAYTVLGLQTAQLKQVIADIEKVYEKSMRAFEMILKEIELLAGSLSRFGFAKPESPLSDSSSRIAPFAMLGISLSELRTLLDSGISLAQRIQDTGLKASETAARLSEYIEQIREIGFETHLVALNAIVKSAHLGEAGKSLEVLAHQVKTLSDDSGSFVENVAEILVSVSHSALDMQARISDKEKKEIQSSNSSEALDLGIENISYIYELFSADALKAFRSAEVLNAEISEIISGLEFFPVLSEELNEYLIRLDDMANTLNYRTDTDFETPSADETDRLARRYSMRQERGIHKQFVAQVSPTSDDAGKSAEQKDMEKSEDNLGDNIELF